MDDSIVGHRQISFSNFGMAMDVANDRNICKSIISIEIEKLKTKYDMEISKLYKIVDLLDKKLISLNEEILNFPIWGSGFVVIKTDYCNQLDKLIKANIPNDAIIYSSLETEAKIEDIKMQSKTESHTSH
jgi:hypothetical protein